MDWTEVLSLVATTKKNVIGKIERRVAFAAVVNREDVKDALLAHDSPRAALDELRAHLPTKTPTKALADAVAMMERGAAAALKAATTPKKPEKVRRKSREERLDDAHEKAKGGTRAKTHCPPGTFPCTELGNAERLIHMTNGQLRYSPERQKWIVWSGTHWVWDDVAVVKTFAQKVVRSILLEAGAATEDADLRSALRSWSAKSESSHSIKAMIELATSVPGVAVRVDQLDRDPWLLNVRNGTLDLRSGELRPAAPEDLITKRADVAFDATAECPAFDAFLVSSLPDKDVREFVMRACGYSITGVIREHAFFVHYGEGRNGKGVLEGTMLRLLGAYGRKIPTSVLLRKRDNAHPVDLLTLMGVRYAGASETEGGKELDDATVKTITSDDVITARGMRENFATFFPQHHLHLSTNHKPVIRDPKKGIWNRVHLIPWLVSFEGDKQDLTLLDRIKGEYPGVLNRLVQGCLEWQRRGLAAPEAVRVAVDEYQAESDVLGRFLSESTIPSDGERIGAMTLYQSYTAWAKDNGETPWTNTAFGRALKERGIEGGRGKHGRWYSGMCLAPAATKSNVNAIRDDEQESQDADALIQELERKKAN